MVFVYKSYISGIILNKFKDKYECDMIRVETNNRIDIRIKGTWRHSLSSKRCFKLIKDENVNIY